MKKVPKIQFSKRRTISLTINKDAELIVKAPIGYPHEMIYEFINSKQNWINKHVDTMQQRKSERLERKFIEGDTFLYLGKEYELIVSSHIRTEIKTEDDKLIMAENLSQATKQNIEIWYKFKASKIFTEIIHEVINRCNLKPAKLRLANAKTRWGSCSSKGSIALNWRLIMADRKVIEYVIVHELAHLQHFDHSTAFWNKVKELMPDYEAYYDWLKNKGHLLDW